MQRGDGSAGAAMAGRGRPSEDYTGQGVEVQFLAEKLGELARQLQDEKDVEHTLGAIVHAATDTVPGAEYASISSVLNRRELHTRAATAELPRRVDQAQYDTGQGPCLDSLYEHRSVRLSDLRTERRWPEFAARARDLGVGSMLSVQLYVTGENLGALNLHSSRPQAFDDESEQVALLFATHASVAMADAETEEHLNTAVVSRDLIGQAKGILIERYKITGHEAFRLLVVASQTTNIKLIEIARHLVETGELAAARKRRPADTTLAPRLTPKPAPPG
jgi:GAF domain-containing protein